MASKRDVWLSLYLDDKNPDTFLNAAESARHAGHKCKTEEGYKRIGWQNKKFFEPKIAAWLDEHGLSESALKLKLVSLLDAEETKFFAHQGEVKSTKHVKALGIQIKALDMAMKMKGMYAPEEVNVNATIEDKREALHRAQQRLEEMRKQKDE